MKAISSFLTNRKKLILILMALVLIFLIYWYRLTIIAIIYPFLISAIIAYILDPIVDLVQKRGVKRIISVLIVYLFFILIFVGIGFFLIPKLVRDLAILLSNLPVYTNNIELLFKKFQESYLKSNLPQNIKDIINTNIQFIEKSLLYLLEGFMNSVLRIFTHILDLVLIPILTFYFLNDAIYFKNQIILLIPKEKRPKLISLAKDIDQIFGNFIRGQIIVSTIVGTLTTICLYILNVKYAIIIGFVAGLANIIPYFGPLIGLFPAIVFALLDSVPKAIYVAIVFTLIHQLESGLITPKIIGESIGIHPVYVIFSLIIGGKVFGGLGLIIAIPVAAAIKLTFRHIIRNISK